MSRPTRRAFLEKSLLAAAAAASAPYASALGAPRRRRQVPPSEVIRIGVIGVRGRGRGHIGEFKNLPGCQVAALCDVDEGVIGPARKSVPEAKYYRDLRQMLDDESIDAVSIATPNHWHSLATIWAVQAGKHVYVEKPVSHNVFEGRQVVAAAAKYGKIVQHGTQARSAPATKDAMEWLRGGGLGAVKLAMGLCYKRRESIGKVEGPQKPPATCDYDLWTGPAELQPLMRQNLHYDWHWVFNTGNGDIGNQGVHQMDIARWGLGVETHPRRVASCGGRLGYVDDGNTPNAQVVWLDYGDKEIVFEVRGLATDPYRGTGIGVVFFGERGTLVSASYEKVQAFDHDGAVIATFEGDASHGQNFLDAVRAGDPGKLTAPILGGHLSSAMGHLGNISHLLGEESALAAVEDPFGGSAAANEAFAGFRAHLAANGLDPAQCRIRRGPALTFDAAAERFTGERAEAANRLLTREYRAPFLLPEI
ncbi:MAG: Gfo/Idh/MocA family oxidoreductase [Planctomycetota bacterium]